MPHSPDDHDEDVHDDDDDDEDYDEDVQVDECDDELASHPLCLQYSWQVLRELLLPRWGIAMKLIENHEIYWNSMLSRAKSLSRDWDSSSDCNVPRKTF